MKKLLSIVSLCLLMTTSVYANKSYETDLSLSCEGKTIAFPGGDEVFFDEYFLHLKGRKSALGTTNVNMLFMDNSSRWAGRPISFENKKNEYFKIEDHFIKWGVTSWKNDYNQPIYYESLDGTLNLNNGNYKVILDLRFTESDLQARFKLRGVCEGVEVAALAIKKMEKTNENNTSKDKAKSEMYEGCVEDSQSSLGNKRAKQYCKCVTTMITDKYSVDEILKDSELSEEQQLRKYSFAGTYCNKNANAPN